MIEVHPSFAIHPGRWLKSEIVDASGFSINDAAQSLSVSRQALSALLNGRASLSARMAIRFEKAFGVSAEALMRMQVRHRVAEARGSVSRVRRMVAA